MNDYELLQLFENIRQKKHSVLNMLKEESQYLKMIAELLIDIECELKKLNLNNKKL